MIIGGGTHRPSPVSNHLQRAFLMTELALKAAETIEGRAPLNVEQALVAGCRKGVPVLPRV